MNEPRPAFGARAPSRSAAPRVASTLVVAIVLGAAPLAAAERSRADVLFEEGRALLEAKNYAAACPKLAESHRLDPGGGSALALALCLEGEGKTASAFAAYQQALFYAKRDKRKDREDAATAKLIELEPKLPKLRVVVSAAARAQGVRVTIDGEPVGPASEGAPASVDPGSHEIAASAAGFRARSSRIVAEPGKTLEFTVDPLPKEAPGAPITPRPLTDSGGSATRTTGLVVGAIGVVGVVVGSYYGLRAMSLGDDVQRRCPTSPCSDLSAIGDNDRAHRYARISDVGLIGGGTLLVGGAVLYLLGAKHPERAPQVALAPGGAMIRWGTSW